MQRGIHNIKIRENPETLLFIKSIEMFETTRLLQEKFAQKTDGPPALDPPADIKVKKEPEPKLAAESKELIVQQQPAGTVIPATIVKIPEFKAEQADKHIEKGIETDWHALVRSIAGKIGFGDLAKIWNSDAVTTMRFKSFKLTRANFAEQYRNYLTTVGQALVDGALDDIHRSCRNPIAKRVAMYDIARSQEVWNAFSTLCQAEYSKNQVVHASASGRYLTAVMVEASVLMTAQLRQSSLAVFERIRRSIDNTLVVNYSF